MSSCYSCSPGLESRLASQEELFASLSDKHAKLKDDLVGKHASLQEDLHAKLEAHQTAHKAALAEHQQATTAALQAQAQQPSNLSGNNQMNGATGSALAQPPNRGSIRGVVGASMNSSLDHGFGFLEQELLAVAEATERELDRLRADVFQFMAEKLDRVPGTDELYKVHKHLQSCLPKVRSCEETVLAVRDDLDALGEAYRALERGQEDIRVGLDQVVFLLGTEEVDNMM